MIQYAVIQTTEPYQIINVFNRKSYAFEARDILNETITGRQYEVKELDPTSVSY